jgi:hypothetical protein|tara:strand:+ start:605 stop:892 length:288 start_codon:yes stop_codon:yes gene_type:complete
MEELTKDELNERASNKVFSKIFHLQEDLAKAKKDVKTGGDGRFSMDLLETVRDATARDLKTYEYIAKLVELDNTCDKSNVQVLKDLCNINLKYEQ